MKEFFRHWDAMVRIYLDSWWMQFWGVVGFRLLRLVRFSFNFAIGKNRTKIAIHAFCEVVKDETLK